MRIFQTFLCSCAAIGVLAVGSVSAQEAPSPDKDFERDLSVSQKPIFEIYELQPARHIDIDAWVDRPSSVYSIGQALHVMVRPHQDAYITVVDVGSSGRVTLLYPNHFQAGTRVRAGTTISIPARSASWQINVGGPAGVDLIQVIASRHPITLPELNELVRTTDTNPTVALGRSGEDVARDLSVQLKPEPAPGKRVPPGFGVRNVLIRIVG